MKVEELRIGNWVQSKINEHGPITHPSDLHNSDMFDGIPLTPEIMVKCGYYYKPAARAGGADMWLGMSFWNHKDGQCNFRGNFDRSKPIRLTLVGYFNTDIQYLHELQNLYYAITKKELPYEEA